ncbi:MAG TPA: ABC transporter permease [Thermomicrobiales bacterium]|nr:ABC transporter permease [Thermomicrobiales bacterium]
MSFAAPARSTSSDRWAWRRHAAVMGATAVTIAKTRIQGMGVLGYAFTWLTFPLMQTLLLAFIYRDDRELLEYAVVAGAGVAILFALIFNGGEILDSERQRGTLGNLFLAPLPRYVWLGGFQLWAMVEAVVNGTIAVATGAWLFDVPLAINAPSVVVTMMLLGVSLWGMSLVLGSLGILARNANFLSNLIFPFLTLFAGTMYPIDRMPDWIRIPARCLPFGYGIDALVAALTRNATLVELRGSLLPLLGFAVVLPVLGTAMFRMMERAVRAIGSLEIT